MAVQSFYLEHFTNNYWGLKGLFEQSEAFSEIEELSKNQKVLKQPTKETPYFNRWNVIWIAITQPFCLVLSCFFSGISTMSFVFSLTKISRIFAVLSQQILRDWEELCHQWDFEKNPLLIPSFKTHQFTTWDVYGVEEVPYPSIRDQMVRSLTYQNSSLERGAKRSLEAFHQSLGSKPKSWTDWILRRKLAKDPKETNTNEFISLYKNAGLDPAMALLEKKYGLDPFHPSLQSLYGEIKMVEEELHAIRNIHLYSDIGMCRGASLWFIYLYLKTKHLFKDPSKHLIGISNQFVSGMPRQAAVLQALDDTDDLLQLTKIEMPEQKISIYELDKSSERANQKIQSLPEGIYKVGCYHHSLVFIKVSEKEQYVWNPSLGLLLMNGDEMLEMIRGHYYKPGDPRSLIYFHRYESLAREAN